jgi:hypothetical protein
VLLLLLIPYFSWSGESVDSHAENWGQIQHENVRDAIPKKNWSSVKIKIFRKIDEQYFRGAQTDSQLAEVLRLVNDPEVTPFMSIAQQESIAHV